jgi:hypothetical protein
MKKSVFIAAAVVLGLANAAGIAHATDIILVNPDNGLPWSWSTQAECQADGPALRLEDFHEDAVYKWWFCSAGDDGLWYLHNTDTPS